MKIVLFADSYLPYLSGVSQSVHRFATGLVQNGAQVLVVAPHYAQNHDRQMPYEVLRVPSIHLGFYPKFRVAWPFGKKVLKKIKEFNPDILHTHSPFQMGLVALNISKKIKKPLVFTHHTLFLDYVHFAPLGVRLIARILLQRHLHWFDNACHLVVTPTPPIKDYLISEKIRSRIEVLPTGVLPPVAGASGSIREEHHLPEDAFLLLYVGRLSKEKNIGFLLESMAELCQKDSKMYFLLVAGGPLKSEFEKWVSQRGLSRQIIFAGEKSQEQLSLYYSQSNLFVCASKTETQGLVLIEAGRCGLPVVALGYQGVLNMIQNGINGFTASENKLEFQSRVNKLRGDAGLLQNLRLSSQKFVLENFDQVKLSKKLLDLYKNVGGKS